MEKRRNRKFIIIAIIIALITLVGAILVPLSFGIIGSASYKADLDLVEKINKDYAKDKNEKSVLSYHTAHDAFNEIKDHGYEVNKLKNVSSKNHFIAWYSVDDKFYLVNELDATYRRGEEDILINKKYDFFRIYDEVPALQGYSIYLTSENIVRTINNLVVGFDSGENYSVNELTFNRENAEEVKDVIIRTNIATKAKIYGSSYGTGDIINHYGEASEVEVSVSNDSYHEFGSVAKSTVLKGHYVAEKGCTIAYLDASASKGDVTLDLENAAIIGTVKNSNLTNRVIINAQKDAKVVNVLATSLGADVKVNFASRPYYSNTFDQETLVDGNHFDISGIGNQGLYNKNLPQANKTCSDGACHHYISNENSSIKICEKCGSYELVELKAEISNEDIISSTYVYTHNDSTYQKIKSHEHTYNEPLWTWDSYDKVEAKFICTDKDCEESIKFEVGEDNITTNVILEPTCTKSGTAEHKARLTFNGKEFTNTKLEKLKSLGHDMHPVSGKDATCTESGYLDYEECSRCGYNTKVILEPHGHTKGEIIELNRVESTCTVKGSYDAIAYCTVCGEEAYHEHIELPLAPHVGEPCEVCGKTTITPKFDKDFLCRLGNLNEIPLSWLFENSNLINKFEIISLSGNTSGTVNNGSIKLEGLGRVDLIVNEKYHYEYEVVEAINSLSAISATSSSVALLGDATVGELQIANGYHFYGNGYTLKVYSKGTSLNASGMVKGFVDIYDGGKLDNVRLICPVYPKAFFYSTSGMEYVTQASNLDYQLDSEHRYYKYQFSAVAIRGKGEISNSFIYGGRNNVYVGGSSTISNCVLENGSLANIQLLSDNSDSLTLIDVTTSAHLTYDDINEEGKKVKVCGVGIISGSGDRDKMSSETNPTIKIEGNFKQYNYFGESYKDEVASSRFASSIVDTALKLDDLVTYYNNEKYVNSGIIYLNNLSGTTLPILSNYKTSELTAGGASAGYVYSIYKDHEVDFKDFKNEYIPTRQGDLIASINYEGLTLNKTYDVLGNVFNYIYTVNDNFVFDKSKLSVRLGESIPSFKVNYSYVDEIKEVGNLVEIKDIGEHYFDIIIPSHSLSYRITIIKVDESVSSPEIIEAPTLDWIHLGTPSSNSFAFDVLSGIKIKYYSNKERTYVTHLASEIFPTYDKLGKLNDTNRLTLYSLNNIKITFVSSAGFHSSENNGNGYPYFVSGKFYAAGTNLKLSSYSMQYDRATTITYTIEDYVGNISLRNKATIKSYVQVATGTSGTYYNVESFNLGILSTSAPKY